MCGRFAMSLGEPNDITNAVSVVGGAAGGGGAAWADLSEAENYEPRPEVRPTTHVPVAFASATAPASLSGVAGCGNPVAVRFMRWGLIPSFADRDFLSSGNPPLINARGESVLDKPAFRSILAKSGSRRCVVITSGYMEWYTYEEPGPGRSRAASRKRKIPYLIHRPCPAIDTSSGHQDNTEKAYFPLRLAGVYDTWRGGTEPGEAPSFALVTMAANEHLSWLHHRQPVFLTSDDALQAWLDPSCTPERACEVAFRSAEAVRDLAWTRLQRDLSGPAPAAEQGKPKTVKFAPIQSFFAQPATPKRQQRQPVENESQGDRVSPSGSSDAPISKNGDIRKESEKHSSHPSPGPRPSLSKRLSSPPQKMLLASAKRGLDTRGAGGDGKPKQRRIGDFFAKK